MREIRTSGSARGESWIPLLYRLFLLSNAAKPPSMTYENRPVSYDNAPDFLTIPFNLRYK